VTHGNQVSLTTGVFFILHMEGNLSQDLKNEKRKAKNDDFNNDAARTEVYETSSS